MDIIIEAASKCANKKEAIEYLQRHGYGPGLIPAALEEAGFKDEPVVIDTEKLKEVIKERGKSIQNLSKSVNALGDITTNVVNDIDDTKSLFAKRRK